MEVHNWYLFKKSWLPLVQLPNWRNFLEDNFQAYVANAFHLAQRAFDFSILRVDTKKWIFLRIILFSLRNNRIEFFDFLKNSALTLGSFISYMPILWSLGKVPRNKDFLAWNMHEKGFFKGKIIAVNRFQHSRYELVLNQYPWYYIHEEPAWINRYRR